MVDERPRPGWREPRLERVTRGDERRHSAPRPAESRRAVVIAVELDAVPVYRRGLAKLIHHHDGDRLPALEDDGWAEARTCTHRRLTGGSLLEDEPHRRRGVR